MKSIKKIVSIIITLAVLLSISTGICYADDNQEPNSDTDANCVPQGMIPATPEEIAQWQETCGETLEGARAIEREWEAAPHTRAYWINVSPFTYYGQELNNSCGAASTRMVLKAVTGTNYPENQVRAGCQYSSTSGTTLANCVYYINIMEYVHYYAAYYSTIHTYFTNNLYGAISGGYPAIVSIAATSSNWYYPTQGHALVTYGIMSDKSAYKIADPWGGFIGNSNWKLYTKTDTQLYNVYASTIGYAA